MKNLQLLPSIHKNQAVVKVDFAFDKALIALAKAQKGVRDVRYFQELLGHGSSKTTEIYTHVSKKSLANIKSPLDHIIEHQNTENKHITVLKT